MDWNSLVFHEGNKELQLFIELGIMAAGLEVPFHFHVEGVRGTGKTTLIRAARNHLPHIKRVRGCLYNCDPDVPHCPQHKEGNDNFNTEFVPLPFLEVSHSAKVPTVVGSIDLGKLTSPDNPAVAILPGTLPRAHRGIVFVDEINRLADTSPLLVDVMLDAMGTKPSRLQIEETGLPTVEMPLSVSIWAASNPDEEPGPLQEIRRQLADRFDFVVRIGRPERVEVVRAIINAQSRSAAKLQSGPAPWRRDFNKIELDDSAQEFLSHVYVRFELESIRGVQAIRLGALLHAARRGGSAAGFTDLAAVLPAALRHRMDQDKLQEILQFMKNVSYTGIRRDEMQTVSDVRNRVKAESSIHTSWQGFWRRIKGSRLSKQESGQETENTHEKSTGREEKKSRQRHRRERQAGL